MTIQTKFNIGDKARHSENGICTIEEIEVNIDRTGTTITYTAHHSKYDNLNADHAGTYYESELSEVVPLKNFTVSEERADALAKLEEGCSVAAE
jgi:hypothetical protein